MAKSVDRTGRARKRAARVSLRSFQRVLEVVGETEQGEPIVRSQSSRLVLPEGEQHFRHLVECVRCRRETWGEAALTSADLRPQPPIFCGECTSVSVEVPLPAAREAAPQDLPAEPLQPPAATANREEAAAGTPQRSVADAVKSVEPVLRAHRDQLASSQTAGFERLRDALGERLDGRLHQALAAQTEHLVSRFEAALSERLDQHRLALEVGLDQHRQSLEVTLGQRLENHHQAALTSLGQQAEQRHQQLVYQLAVALGDRLEQHRRALEVTLGQRLENHQQAALTSLGQQAEQRHQQLASQLAVSLEDRLEQHRLTAEQAVTARVEADVQSVVAEIERVRIGQQEVSDAVARLAERAESAGTLSTALLQATGERLFAHLGTLGVQVSELRKELSRIEGAVVDLQSQLEALAKAPLPTT